MKSTSTTPLAPLLQQFFVERLQKQRQASPCTIRTYRDAFRLFLTFIEAKLHKRPADLAIEDLTTQLILDFLDHLERHRKNSIPEALRAPVRLLPAPAQRAGPLHLARPDARRARDPYEAIRSTAGRLSQSRAH